MRDVDRIPDPGRGRSRSAAQTARHNAWRAETAAKQQAARAQAIAQWEAQYEQPWPFSETGEERPRGRSDIPRASRR